MSSVAVLIAWQVDESGPAFSQRRLAYVPHGPDAVAVVAELDVDGFAPEELDGGFLQAARPRLVKRKMKSGKPARRTRRRRFECFMICRLPWCRALVGHGRSRGPAGIKGMLIASRCPQLTRPHAGAKVGRCSDGSRTASPDPKTDEQQRTTVPHARRRGIRGARRPRRRRQRSSDVRRRRATRLVAAR